VSFQGAIAIVANIIVIHHAIAIVIVDVVASCNHCQCCRLTSLLMSSPVVARHCRRCCPPLFLSMSLPVIVVDVVARCCMLLLLMLLPIAVVDVITRRHLRCRCPLCRHHHRQRRCPSHRCHCHHHRLLYIQQCAARPIIQSWLVSFQARLELLL